MRFFCLSRFPKLSRLSRYSLTSKSAALLLTLAFTALYTLQPAAQFGSVFAGEIEQPVIIAHPASVSVKPGDTVEFSVTAQGSENLKYQWYYKKSGWKDWAVWKGHTSAATSATANSSWNMMQVRCTVTDASGSSVTSDAAVITLEQPLALLSQPQDVTVTVNQTVRFSVTAQGSGTLKYQWYYRKLGANAWSVWKGHTTATTSATANATWHLMQVYCKVTDASGRSVRSNAARLTVDQPPAILTQPEDVSANAGKAAAFTLTAQGTGALKYQWYSRMPGEKSWSAVKGQASATFSRTAEKNMDGMQVYCKVTDQSGRSVRSNAARLTIIPELKISSQPAYVTVHAGETAKFEVKASGVGSLQYQWYRKKAGKSDWTLWKGKTDPSISAVADCTWHGMQVYCQITDEAGQTASTRTAVAMITKKSDSRYIIRSFTVKSNKTKIYNGPGTNHTALGTVNAGQQFTALEWGSDSDDVTWFRFLWKGKDAWISRNKTKVSDEFVTIPNRSFKDGGIPIIYLSPSRQIHNAYAAGSTTEQIQMYRVGTALKKILEKEYLCVVYMPEVSMPISLSHRPLDAYNKEADVYLAIHSNATPSAKTTAYGAVGYYFPGSRQSQKLAQNMADEMGRISPFSPTVNSKTVNGMAAFDNVGYGEVRDPSYFGMISVLAEVEYHDNVDSAKWIISNPDKIARALANALEKTIDMQKK